VSPPRPLCSEPDCTHPSVARGVCWKHYARARRAGVVDEVYPKTTISPEAVLLGLPLDGEITGPELGQRIGRHPQVASRYLLKLFDEGKVWRRWNGTRFAYRARR
jgi:hypothetical protein